MHEVRIGEKGQITLPKGIRDHYDLAKGDQVRMIDLGNGIVEVILLRHSRDLPPPAVKARRTASDEQIKKTVQKAASERYARTKRRKG